MTNERTTEEAPATGTTYSCGCPAGECYCPDGSEPRSCGHGPGGTCSAGHCYDCDTCYCGEG